MGSQRSQAWITEISELLRESEIALDVNTIRRTVGIPTWSTALSLLLKLVVSGEISTEETAKGWLFRARRKRRNLNHGVAVERI